MKKKLFIIAVMSFTLIFTSTFSAYAGYVSTVKSFKYGSITIPSYDGDSYEKVHKNDPRFTKAQKKKGKKTFEKYSKLDSKGRARVAFASLNKSLMPKYKRGSISEIKPTGWVQANYSIVSGGWLYNRCHLIGFQLTGVDCDHRPKVAQKDLITGTRYLNVGNGSTGMVKYENKVAKYLKKYPKRHVLYRVTPVYKYKTDKVARGVLMEGESVEDNKINFCVFCYNVQPGVAIDYKTGKSKLVGKTAVKKKTKTVK